MKSVIQIHIICNTKRDWRIRYYYNAQTLYSENAEYFCLFYLYLICFFLSRVLNTFYYINNSVNDYSPNSVRRSEQLICSQPCKHMVLGSKLIKNILLRSGMSYSDTDISFKYNKNRALTLESMWIFLAKKFKKLVKVSESRDSGVRTNFKPPFVGIFYTFQDNSNRLAKNRMWNSSILFFIN